MPGCNGASEEAQSIPLHPDPNPTKALEALTIMCGYLGEALEGDEQGREAFIQGWQHMLLEGMQWQMQDEKTQFGILKNLYGSGRVIEELNRRGTVRFLGASDWEAMLEEALPA